MKSFKQLVKNINRSFGLSFKYAPYLTIGMATIGAVTFLLPVLQSKILGSIVDSLIASLKNGTGALPNLSLPNLPFVAPLASGFFQGTTFLVIIYSLVWVAVRIASELRLFVDKKWSLELEQKIEIAVIKKRVELDLATHEDPKFQDLVQNAFSRGIWPIYNLVDYQFRNIANVLLIITTSVIASSINWKLYIVAIISAIPAFYVRIKYGAEVWSIWSENSPRKRVYEHVRVHLRSRTGIAQSKLLQATAKLLGTAEKILSDFKKDQSKVDSTRFYLAILANIFTAAGFGFALYLLVQDVATGAVTPGTLVFVVGVLGQLIHSIGSLLETIAEQYEKNLFANDIFKFFDTKSKILNKKNGVKLSLKSAPKIEFENVSFKYEGRDDMILENVNFTIESGEHIALVGENGAGKSTLVKLLMRIYDPTAGRILINGVDLKKVDIEDWLSYVSVLLQKYMVHEFTVSEAIAMGRTSGNMSETLVRESSELSGAHEFIDKYKKKYEQQLGKEFEDGIEPSQGQEQKIALARTLYRLQEGFLLILDEPTAAIDPLAETEIFESMEKATDGKNLVLITHRFNTVKGVDKIIVLEYGTVVEQGDHKTLMASGGLYSRMFQSQAKGFIEGSKA